MFIKAGTGLEQFEVSVQLGREKFEKYGWKLMSSHDPPDNSNCFVIGDHHTFNDITQKSVQHFAERGCKVIIYYMEPLPFLTADGAEIMMHATWAGILKALGVNFPYFHKVVFGSHPPMKNVINKYPQFKDTFMYYPYIWIGDGYKCVDPEKINYQYDFFFFGWVQEGSRRKRMLDELNKSFNINPMCTGIWGGARTLEMERSKYILSLAFNDTPDFRVTQFNFSVMNNIPLFSEAYPDMAGDYPGVIPNKHFIELPWNDTEGIKNTINSWLAEPEKIEEIRENLKEFLTEEWSLPYKLCKLFDEAFK